MKGRVQFDSLFEDVSFPSRKCTTVSEASRSLVGIHHTNPRRVRALWRAHRRSARREREGKRGWSGRRGETNSTIFDPAQPTQCHLSADGDPGDAPVGLGQHRYLDSFRKPVKTSACRSILKDKQLQKTYPQCIKHMAYIKEHPSDSPCFGGLGRKRCEGFQLDVSDPCNVQYYLFCEQLFKSATQSWCPSPEGYPQHCCYSQALKEMLDGGKATLPQNHLLQVFPDSPVFSAADRD